MNEADYFVKFARVNLAKDTSYLNSKNYTRISVRHTLAVNSLGYMLRFGEFFSSVK